MTSCVWHHRLCPALIQLQVMMIEEGDREHEDTEELDAPLSCLGITLGFSGEP